MINLIKDKKYQILLILTILWVCLIFITPFLRLWSLDILADVSYYFFSLVDHQLPERSFFILGYQLPVCARCTAIYSAFLLSMIMYPFIMKKVVLIRRNWLFAFALPLVIDGVTQALGFRESNNTLRVITGTFIGLILPYYIIPGYFAMVKELKKYLKNRNID